ncbi:MAG: hypothetical protein ABSD44_06125 [Terracidiphilus sp.]
MAAATRRSLAFFAFVKPLQKLLKFLPLSRMNRAILLRRIGSRGISWLLAHQRGLFATV